MCDALSTVIYVMGLGEIAEYRKETREQSRSDERFCSRVFNDLLIRVKRK